MSTPPETDRLAAAYAHCRTLVREGERDRYLASLLAPPAAHNGLFALYAFAHEAARIRDVVKQPLAGEIRLQWWRDLVMGEARGDVSGSPVAIALLDVIRRYRLPQKVFLDLLDARTFDLYDDPMPSIASLEGYCGETSSILLRLASLIICDGADAGGGDAPGHGGVAFGVVGLLRALPWSARAGQIYVPLEVLDARSVAPEDIIAGRDSPALRVALADLRELARSHYDRFRAALGATPAAARSAFLPVATVPLYLKAMERSDYAPFSQQVEAPQWRRQWRIWRASRGAW